MKKIHVTFKSILGCALLASAANAQNLVPKWINTSITLSSGNNGLAYSPVTGNVLASVCASSTAGNVTIYRLNSSDGTSAGANVPVNSTISGGTFVVGGLAVDTNGVIYASSYGSGTAKIYTWANETSSPTQLGPTFTVGTGSIGKNLTVYGSGNNAVFLLTGTTTTALYVYYDTGVNAWTGKILSPLSTGSCVTSMAFVSWTPTSCKFVSKNTTASGYQNVFNPSAASPIAVTQTAITGWPSGAGTIQNVAYDPVTKLDGTFTRNSASPWTITVNTWETGIPSGTLTAPVAQTAQTGNASGTDGGASGSCCWGNGVYFCMPAVAGFGARAFDVTAFKVSDPLSISNVVAGTNVSFSVVSGGSSLGYQWQLNGTNVSGPEYTGDTTASLTINPVAAGDAGSYTCVVNGVSSSTWTSAVATLALFVPPPPNFSSVDATAIGGGQFKLNFTGAVNASYRIWSTTDPSFSPVTSTWSLVTSGVFTSGVNTYMDTTATGPARYYVITVP